MFALLQNCVDLQESLLKEAHNEWIASIRETELVGRFIYALLNINLLLRFVQLHL